MPMQVCPALLIAPQTAPSAAATTSASSSTIIASLPPSSMSTGVSVSAQVAITFRPVGAGEGELAAPGPAECCAGLTEAGDELEGVGDVGDGGPPGRGQPGADGG